MSKKKFSKKDFDKDCPRFIPMERNKDYNLFDIVDTEKLDYVGFVVPYYELNDCERDCNILNIIDYLLKELKYNE